MVYSYHHHWKVVGVGEDSSSSPTIPPNFCAQNYWCKASKKEDVQAN